MNKYFFGYLFVRFAKVVAVIVCLIGVALTLFKYAQASNAADAVRYRPSVALDQHLDKLKASYARTVRLVSAFNSNSETAKLTTPQFQRELDSDAGFERLQAQLTKVDNDRKVMKGLIVGRFENLIDQLQQKVRAYAASRRAISSPPTTPTATPQSTPTSSPTPHQEPETLFSKELSSEDIDSRLSALNGIENYLKGREVKAETQEGRQGFFDSITEIEKMRKLLPTQPEALVEQKPQRAPAPPVPPSTPEESTLLPSEEVASDLEKCRQGIREAMLTSWELDGAIEQASATAGDEANKCRAATLVVHGIWLSAWGQITLAIIAAAFLAFLILVLADLTQALLDTAISTRVTADTSRKQPESSG